MLSFAVLWIWKLEKLLVFLFWCNLGLDFWCCCDIRMLCVFCSVYSVYCLCVNVCCTVATGISVQLSTTLTDGFPCLFISCSANNRTLLAKTGHGPHFPNFFYCSVCSVLYSVYFLCTCVLYCCHRDIGALFDYPNWGFPCFFLSCKANDRA
jgi:hypothetical protein